MSAERHCHVCQYQGPMKTWLGNYFFPQLMVLLGVIFSFLGGFIFLVWAWGKYKCPNCGALAKNSPCITDVAG